jgi:V/A-type H+-transporting ATPase subunit I
MAIVKMNKFTLLTFESLKNKLLESFQGFEEVHFINLQDESFLEKNEDYRNLQKDTVDEKYSLYEENVSKLKFALDFLEPYITKKSMIKSLKEGKKTISFSELRRITETNEWIDIYEKLKEKEQKLNSLKNDYTKYQTEIENLSPWINFDSSFKTLKNLKSVSYLIGTISLQNEENLKSELSADIPDSYIEILGHSNEDTYFLVLVMKSEEEKAIEIIRKYGFSNFALNYDGVPNEIIKDFKLKLSDINKVSEEVKESIKAFEEKIELLQFSYEYYSNELLKSNAVTNFLKTGKVVAICGWCSVDSSSRMEKLVKDTLATDYVLEFYEVVEDEIEDVPVRLKNNKVVEAFESVTEMFSLPKYNEIDPTPLLAPFYFAFFGMMVADVGYGVLTFIASSIALKVFNLDKKTKNFIQFFFYLSISTTIFGAIYGSYFGNAIKIPGLIDPSRDINTILIMSIVFGIIHIFFGLGIKAYVLIRAGQYLNAFYDVGSWVLTLVGAGLFGAGSLIGLSQGGVQIAKICMFLGMILIVATQGRYAKSFGGKMGSGLYALYGITGYIGDLVSYTRLMALGLAGGSIANALNLIMSYFPGISLFIIGPIFFVAVQMFNLLLSMLGAYVHTCRLQYVEYFSKFYEGGGKPFRAFKPINKYLELKRD